jgi:TM2 domain-containing membrane protein YozV
MNVVNGLANRFCVMIILVLCLFFDSVYASQDSVYATDSLSSLDSTNLLTPFQPFKPISGIPAIDSLPINDWEVETGELSYGKAFLYSLLFPGGGQFYGKRYVQGGFLLFLETALLVDALVARQQVMDGKQTQSQRLLDEAKDLFIQSLSSSDPSALLEQRNTLVVDARESEDTKRITRDLQKSELSWAVGLHFYGVMSAMEIVYLSKKKRPLSLTSRGALWRGLVLPGWGQLYNRKFGKFGMLWMALGNSVASAIYRQEMVDYFKNRRTISIQENQSTAEINRLSQQITEYRKSRNQYLWALGLLYLYALGDGVVDAILEDFDAPERYALVPGSKPFSWEFIVRF